MPSAPQSTVVCKKVSENFENLSEDEIKFVRKMAKELTDTLSITKTIGRALSDKRKQYALMLSR